MGIGRYVVGVALPNFRLGCGYQLIKYKPMASHVQFWGGVEEGQCSLKEDNDNNYLNFLRPAHEEATPEEWLAEEVGLSVERNKQGQEKQKRQFVANEHRVVRWANDAIFSCTISLRFRARSMHNCKYYEMPNSRNATNVKYEHATYHDLPM
jgi:hypothetical protein